MAQPRGSFQRQPPRRDKPVWSQPIGGPPASARRDAWASLARLLRSGVGAPESLRMLAEGAGGSLGKALDGAAEEIERGKTLSQALESQQGLLGADELQMVRAAERVGDMAPVFDGISEDIQAQMALRREILGRATYPCMVLIASTILGPLPMLVSGTVGPYAAAVGTNLLFLFLMGPGSVFLLGRIARIPAINRVLRSFAWRWPWGTGAYRDRVRSRFARVLGRNLESGLPVYESIQTAAAVTGDPRTIAGAEQAARQVRDGGQLAPALGDAKLFGDGDRMQLVSAERSGTLGETFQVLSTYYDDRRQRGVRRLVMVITGLMTVAIAIYVAVDIVSGMRDAIFGPMELLEKEMPHLLR